MISYFTFVTKFPLGNFPLDHAHEYPEKSAVLENYFSKDKSLIKKSHSQVSCAPEFLTFANDGGKDISSLHRPTE